ncbi:MAG: hypothetical protein SNJ75_07305 [Gemmataceae bacterium]
MGTPHFSYRWVLLGAIVLPGLYLPMLMAPFDFSEDSCLVYPQASTWKELLARVAHSTWHEFQTTGPFRPVTWGHWHTAAMLMGPRAEMRRLTRLFWCMLTTGAVLMLLREIGASVTAAFVTAAYALWNPFRAEIWISLGMPEAFAYPYAMLALYAAVRAARSERAWRWDLLGWFLLLICLGIKNVFISLIPALVWLRLMAGQRPWQQQWVGALGYALLAALPLLHIVLLKLDPKPSHFPTRLSLAQALHFTRAFASAITFHTLLPTLLGLALAVRWRALLQPWPIVIGAGLLMVSGMGIYMPITEMYPRYTMPAVWGYDLLFALILTQLEVGSLVWRQLALAGLLITLGIVGWRCLARQDELIARGQMNWLAVRYLEHHFTAEDAVAVVHPRQATTHLDLSQSECFHLIGHLKQRGRVQASMQSGPEPGEAAWVLSGQRYDPGPGYQLEREFVGRRRLLGEDFRCRLWKRVH